jgi:enamine deaminase RidA (YjgF/YER057c/UK114 family)
MISEWIRIGASHLLSICAEAAGGPVGQRFAELLRTVETKLAAEGLSPDDIMFQRMWTRSREARGEASIARGNFFSGQRRAGSSSFQLASRCVGNGDAAIDILALRGATRAPKRIVEFAEPRRYPHFVVRDGLVFVSGMAELAPTLDEQLAGSMAQIKLAMDREGFAWGEVIEARVFLQRGQGVLDDVLRSIDATAGVTVPRVTSTLVDGLATPGKFLEIEVVARKRGD